MKRTMIITITTAVVLLFVSSATAMIVGFLSNPVTATFTVLPYEGPETNLPNHIADCLHGGWMEHTRIDGSSFENQGRCVSYVATHMCRDGNWQTLTRSDGSPFMNRGQCVSYFMILPPNLPSSWSPNTQGVSSDTIEASNESVSVNETNPDPVVADVNASEETDL